MAWDRRRLPELSTPYCRSEPSSLKAHIPGRLYSPLTNRGHQPPRYSGQRCPRLTEEKASTSVVAEGSRLMPDLAFFSARCLLVLLNLARLYATAPFFMPTSLVLMLRGGWRASLPMLQGSGSGQASDLLPDAFFPCSVGVDHHRDDPMLTMTISITRASSPHHDHPHDHQRHLIILIIIIIINNNNIIIIIIININNNIIIIIVIMLVVLVGSISNGWVAGGLIATSTLRIVTLSTRFLLGITP